MKSGKILNSLARVRLFGEEYLIKEPTKVPKLYDLRRNGAVCHVKMEHTEWLMQLTNKYRHDPLAQVPINIDIAGIIIYPDENAEDSDVPEYERLKDLVIRTTKYESKSGIN